MWEDTNRDPGVTGHRYQRASRGGTKSQEMSVPVYSDVQRALECFVSKRGLLSLDTQTRVSHLFLLDYHQISCPLASTPIPPTLHLLGVVETRVGSHIGRAPAQTSSCAASRSTEHSHPKIVSSHELNSAPVGFIHTAQATTCCGGNLFSVGPPSLPQTFFCMCPALTRANASILWHIVRACAFHLSTHCAASALSTVA